MSKRLAVCVTFVLVAAGLVGTAAPSAQAAPKLDVCALLPLADASRIGEQELVVNETPLPGIVTKQPGFVGHCEWSGAGFFQGDGTDPPLFLPNVFVYKYSAKFWKFQITGAKQGGATSVKKTTIAGASKAVVLTAECPPLYYDKVYMRVGKLVVDVQVGAFNTKCPALHAPDFAEVIAGNL